MIRSHKEIGNKIKGIRKSLGISQMKLAEEVGVSFQQIQKYEKGINKISVEMIQQIARVLGMPVNIFFEDEKASVVSEPSGKYNSKRTLTEVTPLTLNQEEITLIRLFRKVDNEKIRKGLLKQLNGVIELGAQKK